MKVIKKLLLIILTLLIIGFLFRGSIYRQLFTYKSIGERTSYSANNDKLIKYIEINADSTQNLNIKDIIKSSLSITSRQLNFTASNNDNDPNNLINSKTAHCIGYATFFATTCNYLLMENNLNGIWVAKPQIGQIFLFGSNIHKYFDSSFLKDHDFVTIENRKTGEVFAVDPTLHDYLLIDFISYEK